MAIDENRVKEFIKFTAAGITVADFSEIRSAIIERYQDAYGTDIDLSTSSADGLFVNNLSLIINNILQTMVTLYSNLDVDYAVSNYLDALCSLSNIKRREATNSTANLLITNIGSSSISNIYELTFVDNAGTKWNYKTEIPLTLLRNETQEIKVTCEELGPVSAPAGFITKLMNTYPLSVSQEEDAILGLNVESDDELRARRSQSLGINGITVLESLKGSLLNISGIRDTYIYNNNTSSTYTTKDGTVIQPHSVYVILRKEEGIEIPDETIGRIIHDKLTPGIHTTQMNTSQTLGTSKHYDYIEKVYNVTIDDSTQTIYWKDASYGAPEIEIAINAYDYFTTDEFSSIANKIISYLNNLPLSQDIDDNNLLITIIEADPKFKGNPTYYVNNITIDSSFTPNPDSYYKYTTFTYSVPNNLYPNQYLLTITGDVE